jgi:type IV pilus assembly protein PilB
MGCDIDQFYRGPGCRHCRNTGYSGRVGLHELMILDDALRDAIVAGSSVSQIRKMAVQSGMITLSFDGFRKVREGLTTVEEVLQAAGESMGYGERKSTAVDAAT